MKNKKIKKSEKEMLIELEVLKQKTVLMQNLSSVEKFYKYYFSLLPTSKTKKEAFKKVNQLYFELFGIYRYCTFENFKKRTVNFT